MANIESRSKDKKSTAKSLSVVEENIKFKPKQIFELTKYVFNIAFKADKYGILVVLLFTVATTFIPLGTTYLTKLLLD